MVTSAPKSKAIFKHGLPRTTENPSHMPRLVGKLRKERTGAPIELLLVPHQTTVKAVATTIITTTSVGTPCQEEERKAAAVTTTTTTTTTATTGKRKNHPHPLMQIPPTVPQKTKTTTPNRPENPAAKPTHPKPHRPRPQKPEAEASNNPIRHHQRSTAPPPPLPSPP